MGNESNRPGTDAASDWDIHSHQDKELVKALGLTSATMLVMGSMIGSGIFLVSAEIAREVSSPALLIGAWLVTGFMTIVAALSYGELAAMMPRAGGQYVYLREALGPLWGFLYGWTLFLVIQTGTIAAVGVAFGKFLGVFFPSISSTHWILHFWKVPPLHLGPMVLGNMEVGLNTQNLMSILLVIVLSVINIFGLKTGALIQNVFTFAKVAALLGPGAVSVYSWDGTRRRWRRILRATSGTTRDWACSTRCRWGWAADGLGGHADHSGGGAGGHAVFRRRLEQRHLHRRGSEATEPQPAAVARARNRRRDRAVCRLQSHLPQRAAARRQPARGHDPRSRHPIRDRRSRGYRRPDPDVRRHRRQLDGGRHHAFEFWMQQRADPGRRAGLLRHGQGWIVLPQRGQAASPPTRRRRFR